MKKNELLTSKYEGDGKKRFADVKEFATMLSISVYTVRRMIGNGSIPAFQLSQRGHKYLIEVERAIAALQKNSIENFIEYRHSEHQSGKRPVIDL